MNKEKALKIYNATSNLIDIKFKEIDLIKHFSLDTNNLHRAVADCSATKAIFDKCKDILGEDWVYIRRPKSKVNANDFSATITEFDTEHLFYDKHFVFTGKLEQFTRKEAFQIVANFGGHPQNGINKETNLQQPEQRFAWLRSKKDNFR